MTQENTGKVKLVAIRYNDYAAATMAEHSLFSGSERLMIEKDQKANHWFVFTGASTHYWGNEAIGKNEDHMAQLHTALGERGKDMPGVQRAPLSDSDKYFDQTIYFDENRQAEKGLASLVEAENLEAFFPNADIQIVEKFDALKDAHEALKQHRTDERAQMRINPETGAGRGLASDENGSNN